MKWSKYMFCLVLLLGSVGCSIAPPTHLLPTSGFIKTEEGLVYRHVRTSRKSVYDRAHIVLPTDVMAAHELRLKVRELADQLLTTRNNQDLVGLIALPTTRLLTRLLVEPPRPPNPPLLMGSIAIQNVKK